MIGAESPSRCDTNMLIYTVWRFSYNAYESEQPHPAPCCLTDIIYVHVNYTHPEKPDTIPVIYTVLYI